jgi:acetyltransferase-like isoleucine patch superfamily enzyme
MMRLTFAWLRSHGRVHAEGRVRLGRGVRFHLAPGAVVTLEDRCDIGSGTRFHVHGEARIGAGAHLGERCVVAAHERVEVGAGAVLDDEVVLIDFDHGIADVERPIRLQNLVTSPVVIGDRAVLASGATVLRGVVVGAGAHVRPRGVVTRDVAPGATVGGVPARPVGL